MKILLLTPVFPPALGGIEQHALNLSKELMKKGHSVEIITTKIGKPNAKAREKIEGLNVHRLSSLKSNQDLAFNGKKMVPAMALKAIQLQKEKNFDLVHAHCPFTLMAALPLKFFFKKPLVATIHGNWINCVKGRRFYNNEICWEYNSKKCSNCLAQSLPAIQLKQKTLKTVAEKTSALIAVSNDVKKSIKLGKNIPIIAIPNVSAKPKKCLSKTSARKKLKIRKNKKIVLFVGSLFEEKGAMLLLQVLPKIVKSFSETELHLVFGHSEKNYAQKMQSFISKNGLQKNIFFHEKIPNEKLLQEYYPMADLVVLPSIWPEPCSTIITEAMNAGKAIIASKVGGNTDLIENGKNGLLFESNNPMDLEKKILSVFQNSKLRTKIESNALKKAKKELNWKKIAERTIVVYEAALKH